MARALADETNLQRLDTEYDPFDGGVRDAWEALAATGRRCCEVLELRLNCLGRYGNAPMLWHDQRKVGNYDAGIRIPEYLFGPLDARRRKTLQRFELRHGRPPKPEEAAEMALFPTRGQEPDRDKSVSYSFFHRPFKLFGSNLSIWDDVSPTRPVTPWQPACSRPAPHWHTSGSTWARSLDRMAEHYVHIAGSELDDLLARVWVAGPGAPNPGEPLPGIPTPLSPEQAKAMAVNVGRRCTPTLGGLCTEQVVVDGGRCPRRTSWTATTATSSS